MNPADENRRRVFRLKFPHSGRLQATITDRTYEIIEVAEFSICVKLPLADLRSGQPTLHSDPLRIAPTQADDSAQEIGPANGEVAEIGRVYTRLGPQNRQCAGTIRWSDGHETKFSGELCKENNGRQIIANVKGIRTEDIVSEQRRLAKRFPAVR